MGASARLKGLGWRRAEALLATMAWGGLRLNAVVVASAMGACGTATWREARDGGLSGDVSDFWAENQWKKRRKWLKIEVKSL